MGLVESIKREAQGNKTKIQSSDAVALEKIFNAMFYLPKDLEEEPKFVKQVITRGLESQERIGLHASAMLISEKDFCLRSQVLSLIYKQLQSELTPVSLMRIFEEGNAIHEKWQRLLIRAGYGKAKNMDYTRYCDEYMMSYTPDIECLIPQFYDGMMIGEIKSVNTYQFQRMTKHPSAWKQCQWYMHLCLQKAKAEGKWNGKDYLKGFVLSDDKNTQDFKLEIYDYDPLLVAPYVERAESIMYHYDRVYQEHKMVARPADAKSPDCKRCAGCVMRDVYWNIGGGRVKLLND